MNIDIEKLSKELQKDGYDQGFIEFVKECEIKPVDCNGCAMGEEESSLVCMSCENNKGLRNNFIQKEKEWYEDESNFPCLCWCNSLIKLIKSSYVFNGDRCFTSDAIIAFDNATPLTKEELLNYCVGAE